MTHTSCWVNHRSLTNTSNSPIMDFKQSSPVFALSEKHQWTWKQGHILFHTHVNYLLGKGGYVLGSVCLFACLSCCLFVFLSVSNITQRVMNGLHWKFYGVVWGGKRNKWLNFGCDPDPATTQQLMSGLDSYAIIKGTIDYIFGWPCWLPNRKSSHYSTN